MKRCTACGQAPSGLISRHDFCEHCSAPLEDLAEPAVAVAMKCYRCGTVFEASRETTLCAACARVAVEEPAPGNAPDSGEGSFLAALLWGASLPLFTRVLFFYFGDPGGSREGLAVHGALAALGALVLVAGLGLITGQSFKQRERGHELLALASFAAACVLLWLFS